MVEERKRKSRNGLLSHSTGMKIFLYFNVCRVGASGNITHEQNAAVLCLLH